MKKFFYKISIYGIICIALLNIISFTGLHFLKKSNFYKPSFLINNFSNKTEFDYFVLGSSRGLTTLNTKTIDSCLHTNGINLSMDDTDLKTHVLMFKHFINNSYHSKYCILTLDIENFIITDTELGNNDYRFFTYADRTYVNQHFRKYEVTAMKPLTNAAIFPFLSYSYFNLELWPPSIIGAMKPNYRNRFDNKGNYAYPDLNPKSYINNFDLIQKEISNPLILEINKLALKNDIELILYIAPYKKKEVCITSNKISNLIINHSKSINQNQLFYDNIHVNKSGRKTATLNFVESFKKLRDNSFQN